MKRLVIFFALTVLFLSCDMLQVDVIDYLDYYSNSAGIGQYTLDGNYPSSKGVSHLPSEEEKKVHFIMRNPKHYALNFEIEWDNKPLGDIEPEYDNHYTLTQISHDTMEMVLKQDFLTLLDTNPLYGDISGTIKIQDDASKRYFETYEYNLIVNTAPPKPEEVIFLKHDDLKTWILAFNLSTLEQRKTIHNDLEFVTINGENFFVDIDNTTGSFTLSDGLTSDEDEVKDGEDITLEDAIGQLYFHNENTVYFVTEIPTAQSPTATISFTDTRGLQSETTTALTSGLVKTQYYVSESNGNDTTGTASANNPYKTLQKAIDTIISLNDPSQTYTIFASGNVGNGIIAPTSNEAHNIRIQGYGSNTNSIGELSIEQSSSNIILAKDIEIATLNVSNNAKVVLSGADIDTIDYSTTNVIVSATEKAISAITIKVPTNTESNTLLITNDGINFSVDDFVLDSANSGSLYMDNGSLYYSVYKQVKLNNDIISTQTLESSGRAYIPSITIDTNYSVSPSTVNITFHKDETTNDLKEAALKNAIVEAFAGKPSGENLHVVLKDDIEVHFASSSISLTLRAIDGYAFNLVSNATKKIVEINIAGDFEASEIIEWASIDFNVPSASDIVGSGIWGINEDGDFKGDSATTITLSDSVNYASIAEAIKNSINVDNVDVAVMTGSLNGIADVGTRSMTATLSAQKGYVFPHGRTEKEITINFNIIQRIDKSDINIDNIMPANDSSAGMAFDGTWRITEGSFSVADATVIIAADKTITNNLIATAIQNAISVHYASISITSNDDNEVSLGSKIMTVTLTPNPGYLFADDEYSIPITFTAKKVISVNIATSTVTAAGGTAGLSAFIITNSGNATSSASFDYFDITNDERLEAIRNAVVSAINNVHPTGIAELESKNVIISDNSSNGQADAIVTLNAAGNYVFGTNGSTTKDVSLIVSAEFIPSLNAYYVAQTGANDDNTGIQSKPFATVQRAVDVINAYKMEAETTIHINGNISLDAQRPNVEGMVVIDGGSNIRNIKLQGTNTTDSINASGMGKRVLYIKGENTTVTLGNNLTITGGNTTSDGGGVYLDSGTFNLSAGTISGNTARSGGGVFQSEGEFYMNGTASISLNTASANGGGVSAGKAFTMSGGAAISNNTGGYSGGVYVDQNAIFIMEGGSINKNNSIGISGGGGGVRTYGDFYMKGGSITGNTSVGNGGGVHVYFHNNTNYGELYLSGSAKITGNTKTDNSGNNVYYYNAENTVGVINVIVDKRLETGADIYITPHSIEPSSVIASGLETGEEMYFTLDSNPNNRPLIVSSIGNLIVGYNIGDIGPGGGKVFSIANGTHKEIKMIVTYTTTRQNVEKEVPEGWYLPSVEELTEVHNNRAILKFYSIVWSSIKSPNNSYYSYIYNLSNGESYLGHYTDDAAAGIAAQSFTP